MDDLIVTITERSSWTCAGEVGLHAHMHVFSDSIVCPVIECNQVYLLKYCTEVVFWDAATWSDSSEANIVLFFSSTVTSATTYCADYIL